MYFSNHFIEEKTNMNKNLDGHTRDSNSDKEFDIQDMDEKNDLQKNVPNDGRNERHPMFFNQNYVHM